MFRTAPVAEPAPVEQGDSPGDHLIPLSVLALDLDAPSAGWRAFLADRHIPILTDNLGRDAISRADARQLLDERREAEVRRQEVVRRQEQQFVDADRRWRSQLPKGLPWHALPDGVSPQQAWAQAEKDAQPKRTSPLQEALSGESMTYHRLPTSEDES